MGSTVGVVRSGDEVVELTDKELKVAVNVGLKLGDRLDRERMRDNLALARVIGTVPSVEEPTTDADKGIVKVSAGVSEQLTFMSLQQDIVKRTYDFRKPLPCP